MEFKSLRGSPGSDFTEVAKQNVPASACAELSQKKKRNYDKESEISKPKI